MKSETCQEMELLLQADHDGELTPAEAARLGAHLQSCKDCAELPARLASLSGRIRQEVSYHAAPEELRARITAMLPQAAQPAPPSRAVRSRFPSWRSWLRPRTVAPFGAGFALAACLVLLVLLPRGPELSDEIVADHIRALQPGHLMDVVSTDQHTVKPWFDGRIDFAPPVKDLKAQGFPLTGGRLDYLAGRPVAVLVYGRRQHVIDLFIWPEPGVAEPVSTSRTGYNTVRWTRGGMTFWAVSDVEPRELRQFASDFQAN